MCAARITQSANGDGLGKKQTESGITPKVIPAWICSQSIGCWQTHENLRQMHNSRGTAGYVSLNREHGRR
jgi:hypothetical protein